MSDKTSSNDDLIKAGPEGLVQLSEDQLDAASGGKTVSKAKTADKAFNAMDGYIRG